MQANVAKRGFISKDFSAINGVDRGCVSAPALCPFHLSAGLIIAI